MEANFLSILIGAFVLYSGYLFLKGLEKTANGISVGLGKGKYSNFGLVIFVSMIGILIFAAWFASI